MQTSTHHAFNNHSHFGRISGTFVLLTQQARAKPPFPQNKNASGDSVLVSFDDGALLSLGEFNTGVIPTVGAGTRMMWYPGKFSFRAGRVDGTQWNDANIRNYSVPIGNSTKGTCPINYLWCVGQQSADAV